MTQEEDCPEGSGHFPSGKQLYNVWQCAVVDKLVLEASEF